MKTFLLMVFLGLSAAPVSQASLLYGASPNQSGASDLNGFLEADDVTFGTSVTITQIMFWSLQGSVGDYAGSIDWSINSDASGIPGASVASGSATPTGVSTGNSAFGFNEFSYAFSVNVAINPGTYWVSLHNGPSNTTPTGDFFWGWSDGNAGNSQSQDLATPSPWTGNFAELSLQLDGTAPETIPEPASMLLTGAGLLVLGMTRGFKK